ncbi:MAG: DUF1232 domain-containing protein [Actinobacteria bacterium]|nr:MAG: DUF1232 domain-containing protein [Actinomycetota bacterium]
MDDALRGRLHDPPRVELTAGRRLVIIGLVTWPQWLLLAAGIAAAMYIAFIACLVFAGRRRDARALAGFIPDCLVLFRRLLSDERVPRRNRLLLVILIGYLAMPFDLVPDFIPVAGQLDDAIIVALVLRAVLRASGPELLREHWRGPTRSLSVLMRLAYGSAVTTNAP